MSRCVRVLRRPLAVVLIPLVALGCYSWQTAKVTPQVLVETEHPKAVRLTMADSTRQELKAPRIATDTLRGLVRVTKYWLSWGDSSVAVALRDVTRVEVRRYSSSRTAALIVGLAVGLAALVGYFISVANCPDCLTSH